MQKKESVLILCFPFARGYLSLCGACFAFSPSRGNIRRPGRLFSNVEVSNNTKLGHMCGNGNVECINDSKGQQKILVRSHTKRTRTLRCLARVTDFSPNDLYVETGFGSVVEETPVVAL